MRDILLQLLVPFLAGQLLRRWIGGFITRHKKVLGYVDRGSILLVVYSAFSAGVVAGIWGRLSVVSLLVLLAVNAALLAVVMVVTTLAARRLRFSTEDAIAIVFCGSKKSLASGLPMATVLFPAATVGLAVSAADVVPPDATDGVRLARATVRRPQGCRRAGQRLSDCRPRRSTPAGPAAHWSRWRRVGAMRKTVKSLPISTIAYKFEYVARSRRKTNSSYRESHSRSADPPYPRRARNIDVAHTRRKKMVAPGNITNGNRRWAQLTRLVSFKGVRS